MKKIYVIILILLLSFSFIVPILPFAIAWGILEDFSTFNEVDPDGCLTVGVNQIDLNINDNTTCWLMKDYGASYFAAGFSHRFNFNLTYNDLLFSYSTAVAWEIGDTNDVNTNTFGLDFFIGYENTTHNRVRLHWFNTTFEDWSSDQWIPLNTFYYMEIIYAPTSNNLTYAIYTDAVYSILLLSDTLLGVPDTVPNLQYLFLAIYRGGGDPTKLILGTIKNLDISGPDITSPTYSALSSSSTVAGGSCQFNATFDDETALETDGRYLFETNNTGSWVADALVNFTSTPETVSVSKTLNSTVGTIVGYRWNFTDNVGNSNTTGIQTLTTTAETAPAIGEFVSPSAVYGNTYFWLNATVNDPDGIQTIKNATVEIGGGVILGWVNGTGFSEVADAGAFCTLDTVTSTTVDVNATAIQVCWYLMLNAEYQDGPVNIVADHTIAYDTADNTGSNSEPALFTFNDAVGGGSGGGTGTVDPISNPPQIIQDIAEALNISPLGVYAILGALGLITFGGLAVTGSKVKKHRKTPSREYRG